MDGKPIDQAVTETIRRCLAAHHPIAAADLARLLAQQGVHAPEGQDPLRWVGEHLDAASGRRSVTWELPDLRLIDVDELYEGLVLTHHLMASELATGVVEVEPDLIPLVLIEQLDDPDEDDAYVVLAAGGRAELGRFLASVDELALAGPAGWLGNGPISGLLAFQITKGELSVIRVTEEPLLAEDAVQALRTAYEQVSQAGTGHEQAVRILDVFVAALAEHPSLFRQPLPPLRDLLPAAGLAVDGKWVRELASEKEPDSVDELAVAGLQIVVEAYRLGATRGPAAVEELGLTAAALARMLSCRLVAPTFADEMIQMAGPLNVAGFAWALLGEHAHNAGPQLVLAVCAEAHGDTLAAEAHMAQALDADPGHKDSLLHAAWYAEDRGDAARALDCLRQAGTGAGDSPHARFLAGFAAPGPATGVPEEPCPCESGRAHRLCCAHRNGHPLHERAGWLYRKAVRYLMRPAGQLAVRAIAEARMRDDPRPLAWKHASLMDPFTQDLGLFERGVLAEFLDVRGVLLPADELALGRSWVGLHRGLYEVTSVQRDRRRLGLRDLATGDRLDVPDEGGVRYAPGLVVYARIGPDGRAERILDVLPIATDLREGMLELLTRDPDPVEIVTWLWRHNGGQE
ncbi:MAG: hypothetical protein ACRDYA_18205 [Egibacteraceae bacterium]